jgi:hypothetical protein
MALDDDTLLVCFCDDEPDVDRDRPCVLVWRENGPLDEVRLRRPSAGCSKRSPRPTSTCPSTSRRPLRAGASPHNLQPRSRNDQSRSCAS